MILLFKDSTLTVDELRSVLDYDPQTGVFTWKVTRGRGRVKPGDIAGCTHSRRGSYEVVLCYNKRLYQMHRLAWLHVYGQWPKGFIDHINLDRTDNRIANLRECDQRLNLANQRVKRSNKSTGVKGVSYDAARGKYTARIRAGNGKRMTWRFDTLDEAASKYQEMALAQYGQFARFGC